ncbi:MAG: hypothetical protein AB1898_26955 [Acidobacteriota bacterium]
MSVVDLREEIRRAAECPSSELSRYWHSAHVEVLRSLLRNPAFSSADAAALLQRKDLPGSIIEGIADLPCVRENYPLILAFLRNPRTPAAVSLRLLKFVYLFDLVTLSLLPALSTEVKRAAEESVLTRLPKLTVGERIALARRAPARILCQVLACENEAVLDAGLGNPQLTEDILLQVVNKSNAPARLILKVASHSRWSCRRSVRLALLHNPRLPLAAALKFLPHLAATDLSDLIENGNLSPQLTRYIERMAKRAPAQADS